MSSKTPRTSPKSAPAAKKDKAPASAQAITSGKKQVEKALETKATLVGDLETQVLVLLRDAVRFIDANEQPRLEAHAHKVDHSPLEDGRSCSTLRHAVTINGMDFDLKFIEDVVEAVDDGDFDPNREYDDGEDDWLNARCCLLLESSENILCASLHGFDMSARELLNRNAEDIRKAQKKLECFPENSIYHSGDEEDKAVFEATVRLLCPLDPDVVLHHGLVKDEPVRLLRERLAKYGIR